MARRRQVAVMALAVALWLASGPALAQTPPDSATPPEGTEAQPLTRAEILARQREAKQDEVEPYEISAAEARMLWIERRRFPQNIFVRGWNQLRPLIGGMPSGSGFVIGPGWVNGLDRENFDMEANARVSTRGFTTFDAQVNFPTVRSDSPVLAYARAEARNLTELRFFGIGQGSLKQNKLSYELQDRTFETGLRATLGRFVELTGRGGVMAAQVRGGTGDRPIFEVFPPEIVPGFGGKTDYAVYGGDVTFDLRDDGFPGAGVVVRFDAFRYEDTTTDQFDFDQVVGEVRGYIPIVHRNRRIAVRVRSSHMTGRDGGEVPFYLMETIGGAATLRGFEEYRFRDARNLLINAEYRWEVWTYVDFTFFYDAGKVFREARDMDFQNMQSSGGFGVRVHTPSGFQLRMDLAKSDEGFRFHIGSGPSF